MLIAKKNIQIKVLAGITIFVLLTGVAGNVLPNYATALQDNDTNSTGTQHEPEGGNESSTNETNVGDQISEFVHHAVAAFKQERMEMIDAIHDCRAKIANATTADRDQVRDTCKTNLRAIHDKYLDQRTKYHELFKQFRDSILPFVREAKGLHVEPDEKQAAIGQIMNKMHQMMNEGKKDILQGMHNATKVHEMMNSGHPMLGNMEIDNGKTHMKQGQHS